MVITRRKIRLPESSRKQTADTQLQRKRTALVTEDIEHKESAPRIFIYNESLTLCSLSFKLHSYKTTTICYLWFKFRVIYLGIIHGHRTLENINTLPCIRH